MKKNNFSDTKTANILLLIKEKEHKQLQKWLSSPWAGSSKKCVQLYNYIMKYFPILENPKLNRELIYQKLFPNQTFNDGTIRNLMAELYKSIQSFLIHQRMEQDQDLKDRLLLEELMERKDDLSFDKKINNVIKQQESCKIKSTNQYYNLYSLYTLWYHHPNSTYRIEKGDHLLKQVRTNLLKCFSLQLAPLINEFQERSTIMANESIELIKEKECFDWLYKSCPMENLTLYHNRIFRVETDDNKQFKKLKQAFKTHKNALSEKDQKIHFMSLLNDGIKLLLAGKLTPKKMLDLYKEGLQEKYLLNHGILSERSFTNIVTLSNLSKDFEFTENMINHYANFLLNDHEVEAVAWAKSHQLFNEGAYRKCIEVLSPLPDFNSLTFPLQTKALLLQAYFSELKTDEISFKKFEYFSFSFEKYITRHKLLTKDKKQSYLQFIQLTRLLGLAIYDKNLDKINEITIQIKAAEKIQAHQWLLKMSNTALKKKRR